MAGFRFGPGNLMNELKDNPNVPEHIRKLYGYTLLLSNKERRENMEALIKMFNPRVRAEWNRIKK